MDNKTSDDRLISCPEVSRLCGLGKSTIYKKVKLGDMPQPVRLGRRCSRWYLSEIRRWIDQQRSYDITTTRGKIFDSDGFDHVDCASHKVLRAGR